MDKQEVINEIEKIDYQNLKYNSPERMLSEQKQLIIDIIEQFDEPMHDKCYEKMADYEKQIGDLERQIEEMEDRKPQKVKVPDFVAEWYEMNKKNLEYRIWNYIQTWNDQGWNDFKNWMNKSSIKSLEILTKMQYGYEIEKEPKYEVDFGHDTILYQADSEFWIEARENNEGVFKQEFTEKEIKSIDERYWAFAVPVKASVEDYEVEEETKWVVKSNRLYFTGITQLIASDSITYNFTTDEKRAHVFDDKESAEKEASFFDGTVEKAEV